MLEQAAPRRGGCETDVFERGTLSPGLPHDGGGGECELLAGWQHRGRHVQRSEALSMMPGVCSYSCGQWSAGGESRAAPAGAQTERHMTSLNRLLEGVGHATRPTQCNSREIIIYCAVTKGEATPGRGRAARRCTLPRSPGYRQVSRCGSPR